MTSNYPFKTCMVFYSNAIILFLGTVAGGGGGGVITVTLINEASG